MTWSSQLLLLCFFFFLLLLLGLQHHQSGILQKNILTSINIYWVHIRLFIYDKSTSRVFSHDWEWNVYLCCYLSLVHFSVFDDKSRFGHLCSSCLSPLAQSHPKTTTLIKITKLYSNKKHFLIIQQKICPLANRRKLSFVSTKKSRDVNTELVSSTRPLSINAVTVDDKVTLSQSHVISACHKQLLFKIWASDVSFKYQTWKLDRQRERQTDGWTRRFLLYFLKRCWRMQNAQNMPRKNHQLTWFPAHCKTFHPLWTQRNMSPRNLWRVCSWHSSCIL